MSNKILALTTDGRMTYCRAPIDKRGKGRCNHITHKEDHEDIDDFMDRAEYLILRLEKVYEPEVQEARERSMYNIEHNDTGIILDGVQEKYRIDDNYIKMDSADATEGLSEELVSKVLSHSNLDHVEYECRPLKVDGIDLNSNCSISKNFLKDGEEIVTLQSMFTFREVMKLNDIEKIDDQFDFLVREVKNKTGQDISKYLIKNISLDIITLNPDRHLNNLAVIRKEDGTFREAPCFDNGLSLMSSSADDRSPFTKSLEENESDVNLITFNAECSDKYVELIKRKKIQLELSDEDLLQFDIDGLYNTISNYKNHFYNKENVKRSVDVLISRLEKMEGKVWFKKIWILL